MRAFLAIDVPQELKQKALALQKELPTKCMRLVQPENMHITLNFYGEISKEAADSIIEDLKEKAEQEKVLKRTTIVLSSVGVFPSPSYVRVVWIGIEGCEELAKAACQTRMKGKCADHCHLTLARVKCKADLKAFLERHKNDVFGSFAVDHLTLYKSMLTRQGPIYEPISVIELGDGRLTD